VLFSGDAFNPSLMSTVTKGKHMVPILNELGVGCAVFGNHDFDFGVDTLVKYSNQCKFPWLMSNVNLGATHQPLASGLKSHLMEWNGVKIGLVGLVEEDWLQTIVNLPSVEFLDFVLEGRRLAAALRSQGAQLVIALTHMRMPNAIKLAQEAEIDLVLNGHDHFYETHQAEGTGTWVVNSGTDFRNATLISVQISDGQPPRYEMERVDITSRYEEDPVVKKIVQEYNQETESRLQKIIGWAGVVLDARNETVRTRESNLGDYIADIVRAETGADVALFNGGTLRSDSTYGPGEFTLKHLVSILPFHDPVMIIEITGKQLQAALENSVSKLPLQEGRFAQLSGLRMVYTQRQPPGQRILSVEVKGKPLNFEKKYTLATKAYIAQGHDGYDSLTGSRIIVDEENARLLPAIVRCYLTKLGALQAVRKVRVNEIVKNAFKKVRFVPKNSQPSSLALIAPKVDGRIQEYDGLLPYQPAPVTILPSEEREAKIGMDCLGTPQTDAELACTTREALIQELLHLRTENANLRAELEKLTKIC